MFRIGLALRNALRHKFRTGLTVTGLVIAVVAFGLLRTVVDAWYAGARAASNGRMVTRNAISLVFSLPLNYESRIRAVDGVTVVARSNWFGGIYQDRRKFFAQFAISENYLDLYPEFVLAEGERLAWRRDRRGCLVGRQLAELYGFKTGDVLALRGTIYPGTWEFVVRGVFDGVDSTRITRQMLFHWDYLNEKVRASSPQRADQVGVYVLGIARPEEGAGVARAVDALFRNSIAETHTETEQAFQLGFVAMSNEIIAAIRVVSYVIILIILAVLANTMAMNARERGAEHATLKALGFGPAFVASVIFFESVLIAAVGGVLAVAATPFATATFKHFAGSVFPVFAVSRETYLLQVACALGVGIAAAVIPAVQAARVRIADGLRAIG